MKKSEMIQKLSDYMTSMKLGMLNGDEEYLAQEIIDFVIAEGMLPPTTNLSKIDAIDNAWEEE